MTSMKILHSVFFEQILPIQDNLTNTCVSVTQKRLALQDALKCDDMARAWKALKTYQEEFETLVNYISSNKSNLVLRKQPEFEWTWERDSWMSTCWKWEKTMIYASGYEINHRIAIEHMQNEKWKEASQRLSDASRYAKTLIDKILPSWVWKNDQTIYVTFTEYWHSKLYYSLATKNLCTLQFAYATKGISDNNAIKLLNRIEYCSNRSIAYWAS